MRLDKFLADMQIGTRTQIKEYIRKGMVTVNDVLVKKPETQVSESDKITYLGKILYYNKFQYYMLYKPGGVVTATKDDHDKTVMDLLPGNLGRNLSPVGRLDKDTEGLLLITNDGELSHNLLSPKKHAPKTYYVEAEGVVDDECISMLENGVDIGDDKITLPARVKLKGKSDDKYFIELTITEGRFHQVKRMVKAIGGNVTYLKRISMGNLFLDENLKKGDFRPLTDDEVLGLKNLR